MLIYSYSPSLSQISLKNSSGKVVFQNLAKIEMMQNKNRLFGRHFETEQHFILFYFIFFYFLFFIFYFFFCRIVIFYSPYIYGAIFIAKFRWKSGFLTGGSMEPLGHQRE